MKRRAFITLLSSAATWPLTAWAQQPRGYQRIGWLSITPEMIPTGTHVSWQTPPEIGCAGRRPDV
jgi:hypothetical protein